MTRQITLCIILVAVGIVMVSAQVSFAWHYSSGCGNSSSYFGASHGGSFGRHFRHQPKIYRQYEFDGGYGRYHTEYEWMRAKYGFINL